MKKISFVLFSVFILFTACKKFNDEPQDIIHNLSNLLASPDFDWETSRNVNFSIYSEETTILQITSVDGNIFYHDGFYSIYDSIQESYKVSINFPVYINEVVINSVPVSIINDNVEFSLSKKNIINNKSFNKDGIVSLWNLNENSGTIVYDSEDGNDGTIYGASWTEGISGSALKFDGKNDYVSIPDADNLDITQSLSIMAWAKTEKNVTAKVVQKGDWDGYNIALDKWKGWKGSIRMTNNTSHGLKWGEGRPLLKEWYHIALTYDGSQMKLYVNGQEKSSKAVAGELKVNSRPVSFGSDNGAQKFFKGTIDDVRIYSQALTAEEIQAIYNGQQGTDSDGDGVPDDEDAYPYDPERAFNNFYPSGDYASLAFEDLWPGLGDYDFNDLVLDYQFEIVTSASNKVTEIYGNFVVRAIGASLFNGFGFQFPNDNIQANDITVSGYDLQDGYITLNANGTEAGQGKTTIIVFDNAYNILQSSSGFGVNVDPAYPYVAPDTVKITMVFTQGIYSLGDIDMINFNPFLIVDKIRGKEIHLADYPPTSLVDASYFGTLHDDSDPGIGRYYKTENNLPWAINIIESFDYTIEKVEITYGYLKFYEWAESGGTSYPDWYKDEPGYRDNSKIYPIP